MDPTGIEDQSKPQPNENSDSQNVQPLYRGAWAETVQDGDRIPVGGNIFEDAMSLTVEVDKDWFDGRSATFTPEKIAAVFEENKAKGFLEVFREKGVDLDPQLLHSLMQVQFTMQRILEVDRSKSPEAQRSEAYFKTEGQRKLSEFVGTSECAEQAIVGKMLLDKLGIPSALMNGVLVVDKTEDPMDHAFLVLDDPDTEGSVVFDIARPKVSENGYPRIMRSPAKITYDTFKNRKDYVVPTQDIYNGTTAYYGVGHPMSMDMEFSDQPAKTEAAS